MPCFGRRIRFLPLLFLGLASSARAQSCEPARTALVLSGGGVKGLAHLGVLRALDSLGIRPDLIVGTSMGAILGGLYASGYSARQIDSLSRSLPIAEIVRPFRPPAPHPWDNRLPQLFVVKGRSGFEFQTGIVDESQPNAGLNRMMLRGNLLARGRFDRLPIPFLAIATDLRNRETVVLDRGDLARAVRASSAIPLVFPPVPLAGAILVDGGLSANIPVAQARTAGARRVIVSDVTEHPETELDVESPIALADQLLGFLFQQPPAPLGPDDIFVRPAVQGYRSLDFSRETIAEVLAAGRTAADAAFGRAACLRPASGSPPSGRLPATLSGWTVEGSAPDSVLIDRMLALSTGAPIDVGELGDRLVRLADAEAFRGVWLNPSGSADSLRFEIEPIRTPGAVGGAGVAYDHELGGRAWGGVFGRRIFGTTLEASALLSLGRFQSELYGVGLWHFDAGWSRVTPNVRLRLRAEDVRRFDPDGAELPPIATTDARVGVGVDFRVGAGLHVAPAAEYLVWGGHRLGGESAVGASLRLQRHESRGVRLVGEGIVADRFQLARAEVTWPIEARGWSLEPAVRLGWGAELPPQWTLPLGGDGGFPGLHIGELRGEREVMASVRIGLRVKGPIQLRLLLASGRTWSPRVADPDWLAGARLGLGTDTPLGPMDVGYGVASNGRGALYLRFGSWF